MASRTDSRPTVAGRIPLNEIAAHIQVIKKENKNVRIYDNFHINPNKFNLYADKPNLVNPVSTKNATSLNDVDKKDDKSTDSEVQSKIASHSLPPKKKFSFPQTSNQELGWFSDEIKPTKILGKKKCPETKYAAAYYATTGTNPYVAQNK